MMKDMLDALYTKFPHAKVNSTYLYVLGIQVIINMSFSKDRIELGYEMIMHYAFS